MLLISVKLLKDYHLFLFLLILFFFGFFSLDHSFFVPLTRIFFFLIFEFFSSSYSHFFIPLIRTFFFLLFVFFSSSYSYFFFHCTHRVPSEHFIITLHFTAQNNIVPAAVTVAKFQSKGFFL